MKRETERINATAVVLLRPGNSADFEIFLTRPPRGMNNSAQTYAFPGGIIRKEDYTDKMLRRCRGLSRTEARGILGAHLAPALALGHWVAAVRELFEATGVLLAAHMEGSPLALNDIDARARFARHHRALLKHDIDFQTLLEIENLLCDAARLSYFSHWQTPSQLPGRSDTRFFLTVLPQDQTPLSASSQEVLQSVWVTPDRGLSLFERGELPMAFSTFASLRTLADFDSLESLSREYNLSTRA